MNIATVSLTPAEIFQGAIAGIIYRIRGMKPGRKQRHGLADEDSWDASIEGALGEMAFAKWRNVYWVVTPLSNRDDGDVGDEEVRTTTYENGRLLIHKDDKDHRRYWLMTGASGRYVIRGYVFGRDGKKEEFWCDPTNRGRWAYFVPQSELHDEAA